MILQGQKGPFLCNNPMASHVQRAHPWLAYVSMTFRSNGTKGYIQREYLKGLSLCRSETVVESRMSFEFISLKKKSGS